MFCWLYFDRCSSAGGPLTGRRAVSTWTSVSPPPVSGRGRRIARARCSQTQRRGGSRRRRRQDDGGQCRFSARCRAAKQRASSRGGGFRDADHNDCSSSSHVSDARLGLRRGAARRRASLDAGKSCSCAADEQALMTLVFKPKNGR